MFDIPIELALGTLLIVIAVSIIVGFLLAIRVACKLGNANSGRWR